MTPAEAGAIIVHEPDWAEEFEREKDLTPAQGAPWYRDRDAFERVLRAYRKYHHTGQAPNRMPIDATTAIIALAKMGITPERFLQFVTSEQLQIDEHCWLINERAWRITAIEDRVIHLDSFGDLKQIDMNAVKWDKYVEARVAILT